MMSPKLRLMSSIVKLLSKTPKTKCPSAQKSGRGNTNVLKDMSHPLKDSWFLSFQPNITPAMVNQDYGGEWSVAQEKLLKPVDYIQTIEELWSTFNSVPRMTSLGAGDTIILSRRGKNPRFESFPEGRRIQLTFPSLTSGEKAVEVVLAAVVGEQVTKLCEMESTCDVIRIAHKPSFQHKDCIRLEIWLNSSKHVEAVSNFLRDQLTEKGVAVFDMKETKLE